MQIKQLKSIINANFLSPWSDELDIDAFLAPPPFSNKQKKPRANFIKYAEQPNQNQNDKSIEQEAKKTLLNIDSDKKHQNRTQIKSYIHKKSKNKLPHLSAQEIYDFKLPSISKAYDSIDYTSSNVLPQDIKKGILEEIDVFRKHGDHRKSKLHDGSSKVERSISYGPVSQKVQQKIQTLEPMPLDSIDRAQLKYLKLKGKKYSFESRVESEHKLSSDQYKYIPSQPNITPHYLLFGHSKEDILKKVLQQINKKIK